MDTPVKVNTRARGLTTVMAGELHALIQFGQVSLEDARDALQKANVKLSHLRFPWLRELPEDSPKPETETQPVEEQPAIDEAADNPEGAP